MPQLMPTSLDELSGAMKAGAAGAAAGGAEGGAAAPAAKALPQFELDEVRLEGTERPWHTMPGDHLIFTADWILGLGSVALFCFVHISHIVTSACAILDGRFVRTIGTVRGGTHGS